MGKSIRSKIKRKFRTIKRQTVDPFLTERLKVAQENSPVTVRAEDTSESIERRNDPRKKDSRMGCAAFALAFPGGKTQDHLRRGGVGNPLSCPPVEREMQRASQRGIWAAEDKAKEIAEMAEKVERMEVEKVTKTIKKKKKVKKSETSFNRSNI